MDVNKCTVGLQNGGGMWYDGDASALYDWKFNNLTYENIAFFCRFVAKCFNYARQ
ncbi:MAG: hypothetical protein LRY27_02585 [Chitinophagales bacterium]|nr:hypothetical protein [Chitinophagales bacterium]